MLPVNTGFLGGEKCGLEHLRVCEASGKGIAVNTREHGIDAKSMYAGKKVLVKKIILTDPTSNRTVSTSARSWQ